ncbi:hypothetical protein [Streptomyces sp. NPDC002491]
MTVDNLANFDLLRQGRRPDGADKESQKVSMLALHLCGAVSYM